MRNRGFTLAELLIVIAIIGIIAAVGTPSYARWRATTTVQGAAKEVTVAIDRARTEAKRFNYCRRIERVSNTAYRLQRYTNANCSGTPTQTQDYTMPSGTTLTLASGSVNSVTFLPPYGTTDATVNQYQVNWAADSTITRTVRVTGVFGKVVLR